DSLDCNGNGVPDECDIDGGTSGDCNGDHIPDECDAIRFVNDQAPPGQCGLSWETAYHDLQAALMAAGESGGLVTQIWVAAGTYTPAESDGDRGATFQLINNVALYGGFAGTETSPDERDWQTNETILSGDLNGNDGPNFENNDDNSYHVVTAGGTDATALLDGFIITAGNANGGGEDDDGAGIYSDAGSPTLVNCLLVGNSAADDGAGMFNGAGAGPQLTACTLIANTADGSGAGLFNTSSDPLLTNCVIAGNVAQGSGGGVYNLFSSPALTNCVLGGNSSLSFGGGMYNTGLGTEPVLINCTVAGNTASTSGGGIYNSVSSVVPSLTNCILWENDDQGGMDESSQIHGGTPQVTYSCIQGLDTLEGNGNIGEDPLFVDSGGVDGIPGTEDDDLRLLSASPCIDAADNEAVPFDTTDLDADGDTSEPIPYDLDGNPRFVDDPATEDTGNPGELGLAVVDMGAYEFQIEEAVCEGDVNGDGTVDPLDSGFVLTRFGCPVGTGDPSCDTADQNGDGLVDPLDVGFVLARFGECP
ncbi:MAG: hypothetical protein IH988_11700, partial [Planctomycetes bacterium]|nr:hypothetical protein [Planctomycetota bacterium]